MTCPIEQESEATHRRIFICRGDPCELGGIRFDADILRNLSDCIDTACLVKVPNTVEQGQLYTSYVSETFVALDPVEDVGSIDAREGSGRLKEELQTVASKLEVPYLFGHNDMEDHRSLVR